MWQIIGQTRAVSLLQHSLESSTLAHAYLLVGPAHIGKMTLAINLAQALNCAANEKPCLECNSCKKIAAGKHADVRVIGLTRNEDESEAKLIKIEQVQEMQHSASLPPFEGKQKVFIIERAELLSIEAANCLLKTLEEPVARMTFILLTDNEKSLPGTVVSRCQRLELPPLSIADETRALEERYNVEPERARLFAGLSHGCPGWALTAVNDDGLLQKHKEEIDRLFGILRADNEERFAFVAQLAARFSQNRGAVYDTLELWLDFWRDLLLVKLDCDEMMTNINRKDEITEIAGGYRLSEIRKYIESIRAAGVQLRQNVNPRLALEVLMLDIP
jgi:DNA polymerase-3 subunit delta'